MGGDRTLGSRGMMESMHMWQMETDRRVRCQTVHLLEQIRWAVGKPGLTVEANPN